MIQLTVVPGSPAPIWQQIVDGIGQAVLDGRLAPGAGLPSVRALAEQLVVNPNTVAKAYGELVRDGVLLAQPGRGYLVAERRSVYSDEESMRRLEALLDPVVGLVGRLGLPPEQAVAALRRRLGLDPQKKGRQP